MIAEMIASVVTMVFGPPMLSGLATYYDAGPEAHFRSGEPYDPASRTCAVDASIFRLHEDDLFIVMNDRRAWAILRVNDSGYLYRAGQFQRADNGPHFVPAAEDRDETFDVVIDIPVETFIDVFGTNETQVVYVWRLGR